MYYKKIYSEVFSFLKNELINKIELLKCLRPISLSNLAKYYLVCIYKQDVKPLMVKINGD